MNPPRERKSKAFAKPKIPVSIEKSVADIRAGMTREGLMEKYCLDERRLVSLFSKLVEGEHLQETELPPESAVAPVRTPEATATVNVTVSQPLFWCPKCLKPQKEEFEECPRCGIIVAKFLGRSAKHKDLPEEHADSLQNPVSHVPLSTDNRSSLEADSTETEKAEGNAPGPKAPYLTIEPLTVWGIIHRAWQICRDNFWSSFSLLIGPPRLAFYIMVMVGGTLFLAGFQFGPAGLEMSWTRILAAFGATTVLDLFLFFLCQGAAVYGLASVFLVGRAPLVTFWEVAKSMSSTFARASFLPALVIVPVGLLMPSFYVGVPGVPLAAIFPFGAEATISLLTPIATIHLLEMMSGRSYVNAARRTWTLLMTKTDDSWPKRQIFRLLILMLAFLFLDDLAKSAVTFFWIVFKTFLRMVMVNFWGVLPHSFLHHFFGIHLLTASLLERVFPAVLPKAIISAFTTICVVLFYFDMRHRVEGYNFRHLRDLFDRLTGKTVPLASEEGRKSTAAEPLFTAGASVPSGDKPSLLREVQGFFEKTTLLTELIAYVWDAAARFGDYLRNGPYLKNRKAQFLIVTLAVPLLMWIMGTVLIPREVVLMFVILRSFWMVIGVTVVGLVILFDILGSPVVSHNNKRNIVIGAALLAWLLLSLAGFGAPHYPELGRFPGW
ncbi:MAG: hypothetical protein AB1646_18185 [Thermodesulfobacteriota bacterium]